MRVTYSIGIDDREYGRTSVFARWLRFMATFVVVVTASAQPTVLRAEEQRVAPGAEVINAFAQPPFGGGDTLAVYVGNDPEQLTRFEAWLGRSTAGILLHTGAANWEDWSGSIPWMVDRWANVDRTKYWSIPLVPEGATLAEAADGRYDDRYREAASVLAASADGDVVYVRTGWEFNGDWTTWSAIGRDKEYIGAFRRMVDVFRSVGDNFVIEWCPNIGDYGMNPEDAYPGDAYVDIIGMDFYYDPRWTSPDPLTAWQYMVDRPYGLRWHQEFAAARGKPTAYSEWGVALPSSAPYVEAVAEWFADHPVVYQAYWNSDAAFPGKLSAGQMPAPGEAYRRVFGGGTAR